MSKNYDIEKTAHRFRYHPPTSPGAREAHELVRQVVEQAAARLCPVLPEGAGREEALFLTKIEEAMFWANAAIARHWGSEGGTPNPEEENNGDSGSD